jgi:hypothetical protein
MKYIKTVLINIQLYYYSLLDYLDEKSSINHLPGQVIERKYENAKLIRGVRRLVARLRNMTPEARLIEENLLSKDSYKKTRHEIRQELQARHKLLSNPLLKTEDDLVMKVVKMAPAYALEKDLSDVRKALTACIKLAGQNPTDPTYTTESLRLKAKLTALKLEIGRVKNG